MNKLMKIARSLLALILSVVICGQTAVSAAAPQKYISELRLSSASDDETAKRWLTDNGYEVLDVDLNQNTKKDFVFLGYKTTNNPDEAIRDIKVMNMYGGYAVDDASKEIQKMYSDMNEEAQYMMEIVEKFRTSYEGGSKYAAAAKTALNHMTYSIEKDVENEEPLGDYLLEKVTTEDLVQIMFFAESAAAYAMYKALSLGILEDGYTSWMDRAVENMQDSTKQYTPEEEDRAYDLYPYVLDFAEIYIENIEKKEQDENITTEDLTEEESIFQIEFAPFRDCTWDDTDMGEFLTDPNIEPLDLLPIAAAITDEQLTFMDFFGILSFEPQAVNAPESLEKIPEALDGVSPTSVWHGVDRSFYDHPIAVTVEASNEMKLNNTNLGDAILSSNNVTLFAAFGSAVAVLYSICVVNIIASSTLVATRAALTAAQGAYTALFSSAAWATGAAHTAQLGMIGTIEATAARVGSQTARITHAAGSIMRTTIVMIAVMAIITAAIIGYAVYDYYNPTLTDIPYTMFDTKVDENERTAYIRYSAALSHKGDPGDLNSKDGKSWNALYTTKDPKAGKPILADFLGKSGDNSIPDGYSAVSFFGYMAAANLNLGAFKGGNDHYLFFKPDVSYLSVAGSIFTPPLGIAIIAATLLIGIALGAGGMKVYNRKSSKSTAGIKNPI